MWKYRLFVAALMSGLWWGCDSDRIVEPPDYEPPTDITSTPREDADAELAALVVSGELIAPDDIYERIHHDLQLIRRTLADSIPAVTVEFRSFWEPSCFMVRFEPGFFADTLSESYRLFDSLNTALRFERFEDLFWGYRIAWFTGRLHSIRLIELYTGVSGIGLLETWPRVGDGSEWLVYPDGSTYRYFFRQAWGDCLSGCIYSRIYYVTVTGEQVRLVDSLVSTLPYNPAPPWLDTMLMAWDRKKQHFSWRPNGADTTVGYYTNVVGGR